MDLQNTLTFKQLSPMVQNNIETCVVVWNSRCNLISKFEKANYNTHILAFLPDLMEEIEYNVERFIQNEHGKRFFLINLAPYHIKKQKEKAPKLSSQQKFACQIQDELEFVLESLQANQKSFPTFHISHLTPVLERVKNKLMSKETCALTVECLFNLLTTEQEISLDNSEIIFLCDTLILMFWKNGRIPNSIERLMSDILDEFSQFEDGVLHSSYPECPAQEKLSNDDYKKILESFFNQLSVKERLSQISKIYSLEPKEYEVIFKVDGFEENTTGFSIGNVTIYNPEKEKHIKKPWGHTSDVSAIEKNVETQLCIAVKVQGMDSSSMKWKARKSAERALGLITRRKEEKKPLVLSTEYAICDLQGVEVAWGSGGYQFGVRHYSELAKWKEKEYNRLGFWIDNESVNLTIKTWLASMDWYRKAIESEQSSEILLNAWFSIEHLFQGENKISFRIPEFLRKRPNEKNIYAVWHPKEQIAQIQQILSLAKVKRELHAYTSNIAVEFLPSSQKFFQLKYGKKFILPDDVLSKFVEPNGYTYTTGGFVAVSDQVISELKKFQFDEHLQRVEQLRKLFLEDKYCADILCDSVWRIKNDVYNIYRIRNMLVHRATTDSILLEYYAARALEYSFSILTELKWDLLRTKSDSEIKNINYYFQEWVLDANIGMEAVQNGDMAKFRDWVFS